MGRKRRRLPRLTPPPERSECIYVRLPRSRLAMLRFLLEGHDNLCYASTLDRFEATAVVVFSPLQRAEVIGLLDSLEPLLEMQRIRLPGTAPPSLEEAFTQTDCSNPAPLPD